MNGYIAVQQLQGCSEFYIWDFYVVRKKFDDTDNGPPLQSWKLRVNLEHTRVQMPRHLHGFALSLHSQRSAALEDKLP